MNTEELIKDTYIKLYDEQNNKEVSIEEMEEGILAYYNSAGFDFKSIYDVIKQIKKEKNVNENVGSNLD